MSAVQERVSPQLSAAAGLNLSVYRAEHVAERVRRALEREDVPDIDALARLLRNDGGARERFRRSVAVSFSGVFRDPAQFELLETLLPKLVADAPRLRVWSAGCADGSELYSVAVLLDRIGALESSFLLGSDVLEENVQAAKRGSHGGDGLSEQVLQRMRWERRDLITDGPPGGRWHLILCRNVAIYLSAEAKRKLHASLAGVLAARGVLLLGRSERIVSAREIGLELVAPHAYARAA